MWFDLWTLVQQLTIIISTFCLIVMSLRRKNEAFFAFASLAPSKQVPHTFLILSKSWMKEGMWRNVKESVCKCKQGIRGCNLEAGMGYSQKRPGDLKHKAWGVCVWGVCACVCFRKGLWEGRKLGGCRMCCTSKMGTYVYGCPWRPMLQNSDIQ